MINYSTKGRARSIGKNVWSLTQDNYSITVRTDPEYKTEWTSWRPPSVLPYIYMHKGKKMMGQRNRKFKVLEFCIWDFQVQSTGAPLEQ